MIGSRLQPGAGAGVGDVAARVRVGRAVKRVATLLGLYLVPVGATIGLLAVVALNPRHPEDFYVAFLGAARAVAHGHSPYPVVTPALLRGGEAFVYPPQVAWALAPLSFLPLAAASLLVIGGSVVATVGGLRLMGVTDPRCFGVVLIWNATVANETVGAISGILLGLIGLAWHYRESTIRAGLAVAAVGTAKLFLWPVGVWLLATRRFRAAAWAIGIAGVTTVAGWAAIGFAGLSGYPHLLSRLSDVEAPQSYTVASLLHMAGVPLLAGQAVTVALVAPLVVWAWRAGERDLRDRRLFMVAVVASLMLTPIAWTHYFVLLGAVCALASPRLSAIWFVPLVVWVAVPGDRADGHLGSLVVYLVAFAVVVVLAVRRMSSASADVSSLRA
jgi:hypothetical protein